MKKFLVIALILLMSSIALASFYIIETPQGKVLADCTEPKIESCTLNCFVHENPLTKEIIPACFSQPQAEWFK